MKLAIIGSRNLAVDDLGSYVPDNTTEIVSGGARGVDTCARNYAQKKGLKYTEFLPQSGVRTESWTPKKELTKCTQRNKKK